MKPKSGKSIKPVEPTDAEKPEDADEADPGKVEQIKAEQIKAKKGKYGKQTVKPYKKPDPSNPQPGDEKKTSWVELEMLDEDDAPVSGARYEVKLPDGSVATGTLDGDGKARIDGIEPGNCEITFPDFDKESVDKG